MKKLVDQEQELIAKHSGCVIYVTCHIVRLTT